VTTLPLGSGPGSDKVVGKPGTGGVIQRHARPRPYHCTLASRASCSKRPAARCAVLFRARAPERARPSLTIGEESKHRRMLVFRPAGPARRCAPPARRQRKTTLRGAHLGAENEVRRESLPISTAAAHDAIASTRLPRNARATSPSLDTSAGQASPRARTKREQDRTRRSEMIMPASRTTLRHASTTSTPDR